MERVNTILLALLISVSIALISVLVVNPPIKTPDIQTKQESEYGIKNQKSAATHTDSTNPSVTTSTKVVALAAEEKGQAKSYHGDQEGTEFWPPFFGYRLKVTDTLIALFTAGLFIATWWLYRATRTLVIGAERTAQDQLRAYISVTAKLVLNWRHATPQTHALAVGFDIENHGLTIGREIRHNFSMAIFSNPLPNGFAFPEADRQFDQNNSLFPRTSVPVRLFHNQTLTNNEMISIENGATRFHTWGIMTYRDAFQQLRTTRFSFSFGGPDFAASMRNVQGAAWTWENGPGHNDAT
jgi:hypothetical protein